MSAHERGPFDALRAALDDPETLPPLLQRRSVLSAASWLVSGLVVGLVVGWAWL